MRPSFRRFLYYLPLALVVATLFLLAQRYQGPGTDPKPPPALDPIAEEAIRLETRLEERRRRHKAKCGLAAEVIARRKVPARRITSM
jgi:hypothetical protein